MEWGGLRPEKNKEIRRSRILSLLSLLSLSSLLSPLSSLLSLSLSLSIYLSPLYLSTSLYLSLSHPIRSQAALIQKVQEVRRSEALVGLVFTPTQPI